MAYVYYNANPKNNDISDCVLRAISVLTNRSWREVNNELSYLASERGLMFGDVRFVEDYLDERYPRCRHYSKTVGEFAEEHPRGKYAVTMNNHISAIIDGDVIDTFDCSRKILRGCWKIIE